MRTLVSLVTFNSADTIEVCLESVLQQQDVTLRVCVLDNASSDNTVAKVAAFPVELIRSETNLGFSAAHNRILCSAKEEWILVLNPDVVLSPRFLQTLLAAASNRCEIGSLSGKLLRWDTDRAVLDSTGIRATRQQRHIDRGGGQPDRGQYDRRHYIFGVTGAAALYRKSMLEDVCLNGEYFADDFFVYREDVDLAWRAQIQGWKCLYVPDAVARHRRRVIPERRRSLPAELNFHSVKNRLLLRWRNLHWRLYLRYLVPITFRDLGIVGYMLLKERSSLSAISAAWRLRPRHKQFGHEIERRRKVSLAYLRRWFREESMEV